MPREKRRINQLKTGKENNYVDVPIGVTPVFRKIEKAKQKTVVNVGGAGSSKTHSLCQFFIFKRLMVFENYNLLILRKTRQANKHSVHKEFMRILKEYGIYTIECHNKTDLTYYFPDTGSMVWFSGIQDEETLKSTEWDDIWVEEASQITLQNYAFLKTRLYRGSAKFQDPARIWLSLNPNECWVRKLEGIKNVEFIYSNYKDNPYMNEDAKEELESLKQIDYTYWLIFAKGKWAKPKNIIYDPFIMEQAFIEDQFADEILYGIDFGFNKPSAIMQVLVKDGEYFAREILYESGLTNQELIERAKELIPSWQLKRATFYADGAEPARIKEFYNAGFNIHPSDKTKNSVKDGIDYIKRKKIHTLFDNENFNMERERYKWREDKDGQIQDEPVKMFDHAMDAFRYALYTHYTRFGRYTENPKEAQEEAQEAIKEGHDMETAHMELFDEIDMAA